LGAGRRKDLEDDIRQPARANALTTPTLKPHSSSERVVVFPIW
jgi:hypothetical protein